MTDDYFRSSSIGKRELISRPRWFEQSDRSTTRSVIFEISYFRCLRKTPSLSWTRKIHQLAVKLGANLSAVS